MPKLDAGANLTFFVFLRNLSMKCTRIAVCLSLALSAFAGAASASEDLFAVASNRQQTLNPGERLRQVAADPANSRIEIVSANADLVSLDNQDFRLNLPGGISVLAKQTSFEQMESGNTVWIGQLDMGKLPGSASVKGLQPLDEQLNNIIAVRSGDTVRADIRIAGELYRLIPVDGGAHALVEVDQSKFQLDESEDGYAEMVRNANSVEESAPTPVSKAISTIRVMVAFGRSATASVGNEQQAIDLAFAEANQALAATNTEIRFQQAGAIQFYTQSEVSTYSTMLSRLTNGSDGFYDAIGGQRNTNAADIVAYVAPVSAGLCGQAAGIATTNAQAYFVMNPTCLSGNFTFVHEAGHVVGARHDNDPTTSPFAFGHGYVITAANRRTVMARAQAARALAHFLRRITVLAAFH